VARFKIFKFIKVVGAMETPPEVAARLI